MNEIFSSKEMKRFEQKQFLKRNSYSFMEKAGYEAFKFIKENFKYVGDNFAQEARSIHYEKKNTKGIYGKVTAEEIVELKNEGIETTTIPWYDKTEN